MHQSAVTTRLPELSLSTATIVTAEALSAESTASRETPSVLTDRIACLEIQLTNQSERIRAYQGWMIMALNIYLPFLLLGPVLDALTQHKLPELGPYQCISMIELPCLWCVSRLLFGPLTAQRRP